MSGTRQNVVQHMRTPTPNNPPPANTLLDGELSIEQADPVKIWVGVPTSMDPTGRKILYDSSAIPSGGLISVSHDLSLTGDGTSGTPLGVVQATNAQLGGLMLASAADVAAGTIATTAVSPFGLRAELGAAASTLTTTAKTIVPAVNEIAARVTTGVAHDTSMSGTGATASPLAVVQATGILLGGARVGTAVQIAGGVDNTAFITSLGLRGEMGGAASTLTTTAKTVVPAINELAARSGVVNHDTSLTGDGSSGTPLAVVQATGLQLGGARISTAAEVTAGTLDTVIATPFGLRSVTGDPATLVTTAKTLVPSINEIHTTIAQLTGVVIYAGTYDGATKLAVFNGQGGVAAGSAALPAASAANHGAYLITTVAGAGGGPNEPAGAIGIGDWVMSDGAAWTKLPFSQAPLTAANVAVNPSVAGATNVQAALTAIDTKASAASFYDAAVFGGDALTAGTQLTIKAINAGAY